MQLSNTVVRNPHFENEFQIFPQFLNIEGKKQMHTHISTHTQLRKFTQSHTYVRPQILNGSWPTSQKFVLVESPYCPYLLV